MDLRTLISHEISKEELQSGDHIYCYRALRTYTHHGIYVKEGGKDRVIHFTIDPKVCKNCRGERQAEEEKRGGAVVKSCLDCFLDGQSVFRYEYQASISKFLIKNRGTCTTGSADEPGIVLKRAVKMHKTNGFGVYDLLSNNCETFAVYCKTGIRSSVQAICVEATGEAIYSHFVKNPPSLENALKSVAKAILGLEGKLEALKMDMKVHGSPSRSRDF